VGAPLLIQSFPKVLLAGHERATVCEIPAGETKQNKTNYLASWIDLTGAPCF